jgi:hypothetical protein
MRGYTTNCKKTLKDSSEIEALKATYNISNIKRNLS